MRLHFDSTPCRRCGGAGHLPYATAGGICFGCRGGKVQLTRNGRRASQQYEAWARVTLDKLASIVVAGDRVKPTHALFAGFGGMGEQLVTIRRPLTVLAVHPQDEAPEQTTIVFRWTGRKLSEWFNIDTEAGTWTMNFGPQETVRRAPTADELRAVAAMLGKGATLLEEGVTS